MKGILRGLAAVMAVCLALTVVTLTYTFLKKVWFGQRGEGKEQVAFIDVSGMMVSATSTLRELDELLEDKTVKALVVHINSPGGLVAPSQELYEAFKRADAKVPVIVSMASLAASGGYYAALGGRKIFANPGTLTASIGVIMEMVNTEKLYQWAKVERFTLKAGKFKDVGTPLRPMKPEERELLSTMLTDIHAQFRGTVKERRKLSDAELDAVADGRVMTGSQAKAARLIDEFGGLEDAIREAKKVAKLPETAYVRYSDAKEGLLKKILFGTLAGRWETLTDVLPPALGPGWRIALLAPVR
jgi:protease-4